MTAIAIDSETTGLDLRHSCRPFFVTICYESGEQFFWEWAVDPLTRMPTIPKEDIQDIAQHIKEADTLVLHNTKFDYAALYAADPELVKYWEWDKVEDTLIASHLISSNTSHNLTDLAMRYLQVDILPLEEKLRDCCNEARRVARSKFPQWRIAKEGDSDLPSASGKLWGNDMWLPLAIARRCRYSAGHEYWRVLEEYSNADSAVTIALRSALNQMIRERKLDAIYRTRLKVLRIGWMMEHHGITGSSKKLHQQIKEYGSESENAGTICTTIATSMGHSLSLPKSGNNKSLTEFMFAPTGLALPAVKKSKKTGAPSLDKACLDAYEYSLPRRSKALTFVRSLKAKRKRDVAISYMQSYLRFAISLAGFPGFFRLHPSLNPTGTDTLRWSSNNPNEQNISKKEGFNLRYCFGPLPGREWYSIDAQNIELRLPSYEAREEEMITLFERPNDPPYFGSNHLLVSHILHKEKFEQCINADGIVDGRIFKKKYADTLYQWVKNGNFAVTYGAMAESGTADRAYHVQGGQALVEARFTKIKALNVKCIRMAEKYGYVETMPDKTVDPDRGYPLLCSRTDYGKIKPTVPLNYHIQGTAMWWTMKAMIRVQEQLDKWNHKAGEERYRIALQVHDELVLDFPKTDTPPTYDKEHNTRKSNLWRVRECQRLMALGGDDISVPTPTSCEWNCDNWSEGVTL